MDHYDVIVIGAGLAGLQAATDLTSAGKKVIVLEARDRVGGRSMAGEISGQTIDHGGQWVGPGHHRLLSLAKTLGIKTYPQYTAGDSILSLDGKVSRCASDIPKLPLLSLAELALLERRWAREMAALPTDGHPWLAEKAEQWDAESIESWILKHVHTRHAREFARTVVRAVLCAESRQVSYLCFLEYLRQGKGLKSLTEIKGGAQQDKFVGGAWQIPKTMADNLPAEVLLETPVRAISQTESGVEVSGDTRTFSAEHVIVAVPPLLASRIQYSPILNSRRSALAERMPMGSVIKVHIAYKQPFWRQNGLSGSAFGNDRIFNVVFDQTLSDDGPGVLVGFIDGDHATTLSACTQDERKQRVITDLTHYFGDVAANPIDYTDQDWTQEEWSRGCYVAHTAPGILTSFGSALREPCGRIHWAGTETATEWVGYFEGALQSGTRAAKEVLDSLP